MGCLLPWCILKRAIIFPPLRLHFTRQINQPLVQQPFLVSDWAFCPRDRANRLNKATAFSRAAWWCDRSRTSWNVLLREVEKMKYGLPAITSISAAIFFFLLFQSSDFPLLFSILHWSCFSPDGSLAEKGSAAWQCPCLLLSWQGGVATQNTRTTFSRDRVKGGTVPPGLISSASPQRRREAARKQSLTSVEINFTQRKKSCERYMDLYFC